MRGSKTGKIVSLRLLTIITVLAAIPHTTLTHEKCGTYDAMNLFRTTRVTVPRPVLPFYVGTEHFKIWFDTLTIYPDDANLNGIPDYAESCAVYLEYVWNIYFDSLGYKTPVPDSMGLEDPDLYGGDPRTDVYLKSFTSNFYGQTMSTEYFMDKRNASAFIEMNSDMTKLSNYSENPYPALAVTCAHEFYHVIQFGYRYPYTELEIATFIWWLEASAVFHEEFCFNDINDYYYYIPFFQEKPQIPLFANIPDIWYGAVLFTLFLEEFFAPEDVRFTGEFLKSVWERCVDMDPYTSLTQELNIRETNLSTVLQDFSLWRLRVDRYWTENFFVEGRNYSSPKSETIEFENGEITIQNPIVPLSVRYYELPYGHYKYGVKATLDYLNPYSSGWLMTQPMEFYGKEQDTAIYSDTNRTIGIPGRWQYLSIFFAPILYSSTNDSDFILRIEKSEELSVPMEKNIIVSKAYPNPCTNTDSIHFDIDINQPIDMEIAIFDASGEVVWSEEISYIIPQETSLTWDCKNFNGKDVTSGIYIYKISFGKNKIVGKIFIVR